MQNEIRSQTLQDRAGVSEQSPGDDRRALIGQPFTELRKKSFVHDEKNLDTIRPLLFREQAAGFPRDTRQASISRRIKTDEIDEARLHARIRQLLAGAQWNLPNKAAIAFRRCRKNDGPLGQEEARVFFCFRRSRFALSDWIAPRRLADSCWKCSARAVASSRASMKRASAVRWRAPAMISGLLTVSGTRLTKGNMS